MVQFVVGDDLGDNSSLPVATALSWAKAFRKRLLILNGDSLAEFENVDNFFNHINVEVHENYAKSLLVANEQAMRKQVSDMPNQGADIAVDARPGHGAQVLLEEAKNPETKLMVLGYNPKRTLRELFLGTVAEELVHKSNSSLMIVKNDKAAIPKNILVAYDFSHHCDQALEWAKNIHEKFQARVHLVNVVPCYYQGYQSDEVARGELSAKIEEMVAQNIHKFEEKLDKKASHLKAAGIDVVASTILDKKGSVSDKLVEYIGQEEIDLVLMGSHMRGKIKELFLGSVAAALIRKSPCSILVAK